MNQPADAQHGEAAGQALLAAEEARREAAWRPLDRWLALQRTMGWAAVQSTVNRNTPTACLERERRLLAITR